MACITDLEKRRANVAERSRKLYVPSATRRTNSVPELEVPGGGF
jgi:hypothetical protein